VILYVLLAGFLPFDETSMVELFRKIVKVSWRTQRRTRRTQHATRATGQRRAGAISAPIFASLQPDCFLAVFVCSLL
jgi:hypothetical protein